MDIHYKIFQSNKLLVHLETTHVSKTRLLLDASGAMDMICDRIPRAGLFGMLGPVGCLRVMDPSL